MIKKIIVPKSLLLMMLMLLSGCTLFSPVKNAPQNTYIINKINPNTLHAEPTHLTLLVNAPQTTPAYNTTQMAYMTCPYQFSYFSKNSWIDTPAEMLLPLIVQSLQNTCHYHAVVIPPFSGQYDLVLNTQLIKLQQQFLTCPSRAHIVLRAQLVNANTERVISSCQFDVSAAAPEQNPYGGVIAANCATAQLLAQLTQFCLRAS